MAANGTITVKVLGDSSAFDRTMKGVNGTLGKIGGGLKTFGIAVAAAGVATVAAGATIGKALFQQGAQLEALDAKAKTVFGDQIGVVQDWAKKSAAAMGLTKSEATGLAANFADLLIPMGFARDKAADMATKVVGLSGALSEWSGGTKNAAEVSDILAKAMLGETDGLKSLGISISAADVAARLASKGQKELTGAALEQAEALAVQELIFEKSSDAQKAYADGTAKGLRAQAEFKAKIGEVKEALARGFYPIATKIIAFLVDKGVPAFETVGRIAKQVFDALSPQVAAVGAVFRSVFDAVSEVVSRFVSAFTGGEGAVGESAGKLKGIITQVSEVFASAFGAIQAVVETAVKIVQEIWSRFGDDILAAVRGTWAAVSEVIRGALNILTGIFDLIKAILTGKWGEAWEALKKILDGALDALFGLLRWWFTTVLPGIFKGALGALSAAWSFLWNALGTLLGDIFGGLAGLVSGGIGKILDFVKGLPGKVGSALSGLKDIFLAPFRAAFNGIAGLWNNSVGKMSFTIPDWVPGVGGKGFDMPDIPTFHQGGLVPGAPGQEVLALLEAGERVTSAADVASGSGGGTTIVVQVSGSVTTERQLVDAIHAGLLRKQGRGPALGLT